MQLEETTAEIEIRGGAKRDGGAGLLQAIPLLLFQMDAVGKHAVVAGEAVLVIDIEITLVRREEGFDPGDLVLVLAQMGVQIGGRILFAQSPRYRELLGCRSGCKSWCDGIEQATITVPALDKLLALFIAAFCGIKQIIRRIAIHHHLARDHPHVDATGRLEQGIHRLGVNGAEHQRRGGAVSQQLFDKEGGHLAGIFEIVVTPLGREGVAVEPLQQLLAIGPHHLALGIVNVGVDKARHYHLAAVIPHPHFGRNAIFPILPLTEPVDAAVANDQQTILDKTGVGLNLLGLIHHPGDVEEAAAYRFDRVVVFHNRFPVFLVLLTSFAGLTDRSVPLVAPPPARALALVNPPPCWPMTGPRCGR